MLTLNAGGKVIGKCPRTSLRDSDQKLRMIVSINYQPRILSITSDLADLLGYTVEQLLGRSLTILHGPESDALTFCAAIKASAFCQINEMAATLYDRSGVVHRCITSLRPELDTDGHSFGCRILIHPQADHADVQISEGAADSSPSSRRAAHNRYVGLILQTEAHAGAPSPALQREEDALLRGLLASA